MQKIYSRLIYVIYQFSWIVRAQMRGDQDSAFTLSDIPIESASDVLRLPLVNYVARTLQIFA